MKAVSPRPDHCPPKLVQPCPGGLIASQAEDLLHVGGTGPVFLAGDMPDGTKPQIVEAYACPERSYRRSPRPGSGTRDRPAVPEWPSRPLSLHIDCKQTPRAIGVVPDTPGTPPLSRIVPPTRSQSLGNPLPCHQHYILWSVESIGYPLHIHTDLWARDAPRISGKDRETRFDL